MRKLQGFAGIGCRLGSLVVLTGLLIGSSQGLLRAQEASPIQIVRPLDGATVRESVPIRLAVGQLPQDGYVKIDIDNTFRTARLIPSDTDVVYIWDTKAAYQDPDNPGVDKFIEDGTHTIGVTVYDHGSHKIGSAAVTVHVANKVPAFLDGVNLIYNWNQDEVLRYKRHSELNQIGGDTASQNIETADIRFQRSVEDATGGEHFLLRDIVYDDGLINSHGSVSVVQSLYVLKSTYRTVDRYGDLISVEAPFSAGDHFGFSIDQLPGRRVTVGDSWPVKLQASLTWASENPTYLDGTARLDSFEWQDGYPTAKIIETYDGPAQFYPDARAAGTQFRADEVHLTRTVWFAYNAKFLVRELTDMTVSAALTADELSALSVTGATAQVQAPTNPYSPPGGNGAFGGSQGVAGDTTPVSLQVVDDMTLAGI